ncbi:MAG: class I SAM-dependent methyltransferase [Candidatus Omnitrophota bacterium]
MNIINESCFKQIDKQYHEDDNVVATYDKRITNSYKLEHKYFTLDLWIKKLKQKKFKTILDFGSGTGTATIKLLSNKLKAVSVDASMKMMKKLRFKARAVQLSPNCIIADVESLPLKSQCFDGVICMGVLHHLPNKRKAIENQISVLKNNGCVFISEPFKHKPRVSYVYHLLARVGRFLARLFIIKRHSRTKESDLTSKDLILIRSVFEEHGFSCTVRLLTYWPLICACVPEGIMLPIIKFLNKTQVGRVRGDTVIIIAER